MPVLPYVVQYPMQTAFNNAAMPPTSNDSAIPQPPVPTSHPSLVVGGTPAVIVLPTAISTGTPVKMDHQKLK